MKFNGLYYFPFPCLTIAEKEIDALDNLETNYFEAIQLIEDKFRLKGFAILIKLLQKIYSTNGYYMFVSDNVILRLKREFALSNADDIISDVINECLRIGIFSKTMYDAHNILTSNRIQADYLRAVRKRTIIDLQQEYLLPFSLSYLKKAEEKQKTAELLPKTAEDLNKGKGKIEKEKENEVSYVEEGNNLVHSTEDFTSLINKFKNSTNKYTGDVHTLPLGIDMDLLIQKINNSTFLKNANNFTLKQCLKSYDKIIAGVYDDSNKKEKQNINVSSKAHVHERTYSTEELDDLYTDPDSIKFD